MLDCLQILFSVEMLCDMEVLQASEALNSFPDRSDGTIILHFCRVPPPPPPLMDIPVSPLAPPGLDLKGGGGLAPPRPHPPTTYPEMKTFIFIFYFYFYPDALYYTTLYCSVRYEPATLP